MNSFKCKMCGGDLIITEGSNTCECEFCGTKQTVPSADSEKKVNLFNRANRLRMNAEFDKAATVYESIAAEFPEEAEAYWGLCLCSYGIEYVDDPVTGEKKPTCHRTLPTSIMEDNNFDQACEYADPIARRVYREEAKAIDQIQKDILAIVANEQPYDVFICYKETAEEGGRTEDSVLAQNIYDALTEKGMKVFFARITLEDKLGQQYEPYIYAALSSAKVMLAVGTRFEYYDAVWVKNEWMRFLSMMKIDKSKTLIPCYKGLDAYDMPKEFKNLQAQDMNKIGWLQDLVRGIQKLCGFIAPSVSQGPVLPTVSSLLDRGFIQLEDELWDDANKQFNEVLNSNPKCARAYLGLSFVDLRVPTNEKFELLYINGETEGNRNLDRARQFDVTGELTSWFEQLDYKRACQKEHERKIKIENIELIKERIGVNEGIIYNLKKNGTVDIVINSYEEEDEEEDYSGPSRFKIKKEVEKWKDIVQVACGSDGLHMVGLTKQGKVLAAGDNSEGQCDVENWSDIIAIATPKTDSRTIGLKSDGTVVATGDDGVFCACDVEGWTNIVKIYANDSYTAGLKADGTVVTTDKHVDTFKKWTDIVSLSTTCESHLIGLKSNGKYYASGTFLKYWGNPDFVDKELGEIREDVVAMSGGFGTNIAGIKKDGKITEVFTPKESPNEITMMNDIKDKWKDIIQLNFEYCRAIGLKSDGTMLEYAIHNDKPYDTDTWKDIICFVNSYNCLVGVHSDGTVVATGDYLSAVDVSSIKVDI